MSEAKVWAITMVADEADVIEGTLRHMISEHVDGIIVADNLSEDDTRAKIEKVQASSPIPIIIVDDSEKGYFQSKKMTALAKKAHDEFGANIIVPFDADELWCGLKDPLAAALRKTIDKPTKVVQLGLYTYMESGLDNLDAATPFEKIIHHRPNISEMGKVAFWYASDVVINMGNHGVRKGDVPLEVVKLPNEYVISHFPYRSLQQFIHKMRRGAAAYKATNGAFSESVGRHWRAYGQALEMYGEDMMRYLYYSRMYVVDPWSGYVKDPAPFCRWKR